MRKFMLFLIVLTTSTSCMDQHKLQVIGHRGAMGHETENTIASIQKALELKVDMIEIDVFKIASGEIVVFHDDTLERLTNGTGNIEDYTWLELQKLVITGNHKIPLLTEVLDHIDATVALNIELKGAGTAKDVNVILEKYIKEKNWTLDDFLISSFNWDELKMMRQINNKVAIAILIEEANPLEALAIAHELGAVAINPDYEKLDAEIAQKIREAGFKIYPWTVNEPQAILKMKTLGVDGVFTNYPERVE
ncbi:glycerophosphodiester phosphodiesterase family protein [Cellulophaga sp. Hel_I_12]|uniref:glycerophosphodiester phosphodiesterase n=1 Tax=Cellulophaga sp. Hel_I_12 TaxID=1249972 RepID=UPI000646F1E5